MMNRVNLAKSLVAARRIEVGETLTDDDIDIKSPGRGLQPNAYDKLVGRTTTRTLDAGDFFYATDLGDAVPLVRGHPVGHDLREPLELGPAQLPQPRQDDLAVAGKLGEVGVDVGRTALHHAVSLCRAAGGDSHTITVPLP